MRSATVPPADPSTATTGRPALRRALLIGGAVLALVVASIGVSGTSSAEPMRSEVDVAIEATPSEAIVGTTIEVVGSVTGFRPTVAGDGTVAACGDVEATACGDWPTGAYTLSVDGESVQTGELDEDGSVAWSTDDLAVGTHEISLEYGGDDWYEPGSAATSVVITEPAPEPATPGGSYSDASTSMTATAGGQVTVRGEGWMPDSEVTVTMRSEPVVLGMAAVGSDGAFAQTYTIPAGTPAGAHTITLSGVGTDGQPASVVLDLTVLAAGAPASAPSSIAFTG
jgi:hypothetical protein